VTDTSHNRSIVVWGVPGAVPCGEVVSFKAGIKCSADCPPDGWTLEIRDHDGTTVASQPVSATPWPGTAALFHAEFELRSPATVGVFVWQIFSPALHAARSNDDDPRHEETAANFNVRTVPEAECRLTVLAIDRAAQRPVAGLKVVAHPYRTTTDDRGVAELLLPKGRYRLFVSGKDFFPLRLGGELTSDQAIRAELEIDRGPSDAESWS
jgi:hypothetical protein